MQCFCCVLLTLLGLEVCQLQLCRTQPFIHHQWKGWASEAEGMRKRKFNSQASIVDHTSWLRSWCVFVSEPPRSQFQGFQSVASSSKPRAPRVTTPLSMEGGRVMVRQGFLETTQASLFLFLWVITSSILSKLPLFSSLICKVRITITNNLFQRVIMRTKIICDVFSCMSDAYISAAATVLLPPPSWPSGVGIRTMKTP